MGFSTKKWLLLGLVLATLSGALQAQAENKLLQQIEKINPSQFAQVLKKSSSEDKKAALEKSLVSEDSRFLKILLKDKEVLALFDSQPTLAALPIQEGVKENLVLLLKSKPQILKTTLLEGKRTLLQEAVATSDLEIIQLIVQKEKSLLQSIDEAGESVLFAAGRRGKKEIVSYLVGLGGLDIKLKNKKGQTAADVATEAGFVKSAALLGATAK